MLAWCIATLEVAVPLEMYHNSPGCRSAIHAIKHLYILLPFLLNSPLNINIVQLFADGHHSFIFTLHLVQVPV